VNKCDFLEQLRIGLAGLPQKDIEEHLNFYSEIIDDRMEEGLSEEEAALAMGDPGEAARHILADISGTAPAKKAEQKTHGSRAWMIVLLVLGAPLWLSLLLAVFAVFFSLYITLWAVIISLWAVFGAVIGCVPAGIIGGAALMFGGYWFAGAAVLGAGLVCAGVAILLFFCCRGVVKGALLLTKKGTLCIKKCFVKEEAAL